MHKGSIGVHKPDTTDTTKSGKRSTFHKLFSIHDSGPTQKGVPLLSDRQPTPTDSTETKGFSPRDALPSKKGLGLKKRNTTKTEGNSTTPQIQLGQESQVPIISLDPTELSGRGVSVSTDSPRDSLHTSTEGLSSQSIS